MIISINKETSGFEVSISDDPETYTDVHCFSNKEDLLKFINDDLPDLIDEEFTPKASQP